MKRPGRISAAARAVVIAPIRLYRLVSAAFPRRCRYEPTCSRYAIDAVTEVGVLRGLVLASWRLLRCNPWSRGGIDPIEDRPFFRPDGGGTG